MTDHIDQLEQWYEQAERITKTNLPNDGDTIIYPGSVEGSYIVEPNTEGWEPQIVYEDEECRILARAPKPKPAWHDAVAVIAHTARFSERRPFALTHTEDVLDPYNTEWITRDDLIDPVPLIEAKVSGEMVEAARQEAQSRTRTYWERSLVSRMLTAALGLEAE